MFSTRAFVLVSLLAPACFAQSSIVLDLSTAKPGMYYYTIEKTADGKVNLNQIQKVVQIGGTQGPQPVDPPPSPFVPPIITPPAPSPIVAPPDPFPPPAPSPAPIPTESVELRVQSLTDQTLQNGGSVKTAVCLQRAYYIVIGALDDGVISKENAFKALHEASDLAIEQQNESVRWSSWRAGVTSILGENRAQLLDKKELVVLLRKVEAGLNKVINTVINSDRSKDLKDEDYQPIIKMQNQIIELMKKYKGVAK